MAQHMRLPFASAKRATSAPGSLSIETTKDYTGKGGMIAWQLPPVLARTLALPLYGAEPWDDLHLTLCFFPDFALVDQARVQAIMQDVLAKRGSLPGEVAGFGRFSASESSDGKDVLYAALDIPGLEAMREDLVARLERAKQSVSHTHGYTPHVTLMYLAPDEPTPIERIDHLTLRLNHLVLTSPDVAQPLRVSASQKAYAAHPFERQQAKAVREYKALVHKGLQEIFKDLKKRLPDEIAAVKSGISSGTKALDDGKDIMLGALGCEAALSSTAKNVERAFDSWATESDSMLDILQGKRPAYGADGARLSTAEVKRLTDETRLIERLTETNSTKVSSFWRGESYGDLSFLDRYKVGDDITFDRIISASPDRDIAEVFRRGMADIEGHRYPVELELLSGGGRGFEGTWARHSWEEIQKADSGGEFLLRSGTKFRVVRVVPPDAENAFYRISLRKVPT